MDSSAEDCICMGQEDGKGANNAICYYFKKRKKQQFYPPAIASFLSL